MAQADQQEGHARGAVSVALALLRLAAGIGRVGVVRPPFWGHAGVRGVLLMSAQGPARKKGGACQSVIPGV